MSTIPGVDYPWAHPGGAALAAAGKHFACRYLSHDSTKNLTRAEADDLAAHGVWCVLVWETTANRAGAGRTAGVADAKTAEAQAAAAGMPSGRPIYFAVDYDAAPSEVDAYFQGVASVISVTRTGVYGGYRVVKHLKDAGLVSWIWQTSAWSGGQWDPRANIRQPLGTLHINGADCDIDTAYTADYGQWTPGHTPTPPQEEDVQLTDSLTAHKGVWTQADQTASVGDWIALGNLKAGAAAAGVKSLTVQVAALTATVGTLAKAVGDIHPGVDTATLVTAVQQAIADAVVHVAVDVTGPTA